MAGNYNNVASPRAGFRQSSGGSSAFRFFLGLFLLGRPVEGCLADISTPSMEDFMKYDHDQGTEFTDADVEMDVFQDASNYDFDAMVYNLTEGPGYFMLRDAYDRRDMQLALDRVFYDTPNPLARNIHDELPQNDEQHNNYKGMRWNLLKKGKIFQKLVQHPQVLKVSRHLLGPNMILSSYSSNTILPGMKGQKPHLDYPYYRHLMSEDPRAMDFPTPMALNFIICLTKFTNDNGGTAIRPNSHHKPSYPDNVEDFMANMIQVQCNPGDIAIINGPIQHGAMPNLSDGIRSGLLTHLLPVYLKPFEEITVTDDMRETASEDLRKLLALDWPYPTLKE